MADSDDQWHIQKRVPISIIILIMGQLALGVWGASKFDARLEAIELSLPQLTSAAVQDREFGIDQRVRLWDRVMATEKTTMATSADMKAIYAHLAAINRNMDRLLNRMDEDARALKNGVNGGNGGNR